MAQAAETNTIIHLDMDAFFAAIEVLDNPALAGKPVVVGAPHNRRGVVATASYEARKYGIHSAMPSRTAFKLCPHAIFVPPRGERYGEISDRLMGILEQFTPFVEAISVDEAFMDVKGVLHFWGTPRALAQAMKDRIRGELGLTASVGVARNKFLAKIASDLRKPDGLTEVPEDDAAVIAFLAPLPVNRIFGVGKVTEAQLHRAGIRTIGDVQRRDEKTLSGLLGESWARHVWQLAHGIDSRELTLSWEEKSISNETTFDEDIVSPEVMRQTIIELAENVGRRLRRAGKLARTADIKVRFADFSTFSRQCSAPVPFDSDRELIRSVLGLLEKVRIRQAVRLLGVGVSNLVSPGGEAAQSDGQTLLFKQDDFNPDRPRNARLDRAVDRLRQVYGRRILKRGNWQSSADE